MNVRFFRNTHNRLRCYTHIFLQSSSFKANVSLVSQSLNHRDHDFHLARALRNSYTKWPSWVWIKHADDKFYVMLCIVVVHFVISLNRSHWWANLTLTLSLSLQLKKPVFKNYIPYMNQKNSTNKLLKFLTPLEEAHWPWDAFVYISNYKVSEGLKPQSVISDEIRATFTFGQLPLACANREAFELNF